MKPDSQDVQQEQEYLTIAARQRQVRKSTIMLAVLFGIGLLCLWFMIKKSTPQTAMGVVVNDEEKQIEMALQRLPGVRSEMSNRMDEIVKKFYQFSDVQQVQVDDLLKNPFKMERFLSNSWQIYRANESDIDPEIKRQHQLRKQAESMQLLSIMQSAQGRACCMIDDKLLYEGDSIRGFKVEQISNNFVKLTAEDLEVILKLSE